MSRKVRGSRLSGAALFGLTAVTVLYGFHGVNQGKAERRAWKTEARERRAYILPFLQAEEDVRYLRDRQKKLELERQIMRNVPDWEVGKSVFNNPDAFVYDNPRVPLKKAY